MSEPQGTGDCFRVAAQLVIDGEFPEAMICHGKVTHPDDGQRHSHAWIEIEQTMDVPGWNYPVLIRDVLDRSNGHNARLPKELYYKVGKIDPERIRRYDAHAAAWHMHLSGHWGPWGELT